MKVIFLETVPGVARAGEMKEVADGYGRNFLIPRGVARLASPDAINTLEMQRGRRAREEARLEAEVSELAGQLEGKEITLVAKAGAKERLYGAVTSADIVAELERATGIAVDKRKVVLDEPIRQLGSYEVTIKLAGSITSGIKVNVIGEGAPEEAKTEVAEENKVEAGEETKAEATEAEEEPEQIEAAAEESKAETG